MKLEYELNNIDFLEYHLFASSKSALHTKKRNRSRILIPILYVAIGIYYFIKYENLVGPIIWVGIAIVWFVFYPRYSKWRYKRHFEKHVEQNYNNRINKPIHLEFNPDYLDTSDFTSISKIKYSELKEFIELPNHFFLKLNSDLSIIIPKRAVLHIEALKSKMSELNVRYTNEIRWKWK